MKPSKRKPLTRKSKAALKQLLTDRWTEFFNHLLKLQIHDSSNHIGTEQS